MYQYYKGYIIREGTVGIAREKLRKLYFSVGWINSDMPKWFEEKFEIALKNSAWAYSVWDKDELIGLVRIVSDKVMIATVQDLMVHPNYQNKGIGSKLIELCISKLPHGSWFSHTTKNNYSFYEKFGFKKDNIDKEATLVFNGYKMAKKEGNR